MQQKRSASASPRPNGILRWSTLCVLAGGLAGCDNDDSYTFTEQDASMAKLQSGIDQLDAQRTLLKAGEVSNNFHIEGVGYYHAAKNEFYSQQYNLAANDQYFVNGSWQATQGPEYVPPSRPSPEALKKVDEALTLAQKEEEKSGGGNTTSSSSTTHHHGGGFSGTNMLLMYMLLSGNRGFFSPGAGFQHNDRNPDNLNRRANDERRSASGYASANPSYRRAVEHSKATGSPVTPGKSVRGGFGSSSRSSFSSGS